MQLNEIKEMKYINSGDNGKCYDIGNGTVLKLFNKAMPLSEIEKFKYLLEYKNESFLFPFEFIYDEQHFTGYITKKSFGKTLYDNFSSFNIENLSTHSILLEHNIKKLSEGKILFDDLNEGNIMYDGEKIEIIDPDFYHIDVDLPIDVIEMRNLNYYKIVIAGAFKAAIGYGNKTKYILDKINKYQYLEKSASAMMIRIKEEMENYYKEKVNTMGDLHSVLRR